MRKFYYLFLLTLLVLPLSAQGTYAPQQMQDPTALYRLFPFGTGECLRLDTRTGQVTYVQGTVESYKTTALSPTSTENGRYTIYIWEINKGTSQSSATIYLLDQQNGKMWYIVRGINPTTAIYDHLVLTPVGNIKK